MNSIETAIGVFGLKVKEQYEVPESFSSTVSVLKLESGEKVVLKVPYNKSKLFREKMILDRVKGFLPVPEVLEFWPGDENHSGAMVLSYIDGEPITDGIDDQLAYDLGALLGKIHLVSMNNFSITDQPSTDWWQSIREKFSVWYEEIKDHFDADFMKKCQMHFEKAMKEVGEADGPVLIHFDYRPGNVLIKDNKIVGLIDFESSRGGSADLDFTKIKVYVWDKNEHLKEPFIQGYESVRPLPEIDKSLDLYEFFNGFGGLAWCVRRDKMDDEFYDENYQQVWNFIK